MRRFLSVTFALLIAVSAFAFIQDLIPGLGTVIPKPADYDTKVPPAAGGTYADASFKQTNVRRLTNDNTFPGHTGTGGDIYAANSWWSADGKRFLHRNRNTVKLDGGNCPYRDGPDDFLQIVSSTGTVTHSCIPFGYHGAEAGFDPLDSNVFYYIGLTEIHKVTLTPTSGDYDCGPGGAAITCSDVIYYPTAANPLPAGNYIHALGGTLNRFDRSGRYMLLRYGPNEESVASSHLYVYIRSNRIDLDPDSTVPALRQPYANPIDTGTAYQYNYEGLSPDGQYVIAWDTTPMNAIFNDPENFLGSSGAGASWRIDHANRTVDATRKLFWSLGNDHGAFISASDGNTYMFTSNGMDAESGDVYRAKVSYDATLSTSLNDQKGLGADGLPGGPFPDNKLLLRAYGLNYASHYTTAAWGDWAFTATEYMKDKFGPNTEAWNKYNQEMIAINIVSGEIRRLAHHRSRFLPCHPVGDPEVWWCDAPHDDLKCGDCNYINFPRLSAGWAGSAVAYASNLNQKDASNNPQMDVYAIRFDPAPSVVWINSAGVSIDGGFMERNSGSDDVCAGNGGNSQQQITEGDGYLGFTINEITTKRHIGLANWFNSKDPIHILYGIRFQAGGTARVVESGYDKGSDFSYALGTRFRIAIKSNVVTYYQDDEPIYTSLTSPGSYPYMAAASLCTYNPDLNLKATVSNAVILAATRIEVPVTDDGPNQCSPNPVSPHYAAVNDYPSNGDTDFLVCSSYSQQEVFTVPATTVPYDGIDRVEVKWTAKKGAGTAKSRVGLEVFGIQYFKPERTLTSSYSTFIDTWPENPATLKPWRADELVDVKLVYNPTFIAMQLPRPRLTSIVRRVTKTMTQ